MVQNAFVDNVEICVMCVCDKPPRLPLREELVSLGVEVIRNAKGTGVNAIKSAVKETVKGFRKTIKDREKKRFRFFPRVAKQKELERDLRQGRKSITYHDYARKLLEQTSSEDSSSLSSCGSIFTSENEMQPGQGQPGLPTSAEAKVAGKDQRDVQQQTIDSAWAKFTASDQELEAKEILRFPEQGGVLTNVVSGWRHGWDERDSNLAFAVFSQDNQGLKTKVTGDIDASFSWSSEPKYAFPTETYCTSDERDTSNDFNNPFSFTNETPFNDEDDADRTSIHGLSELFGTESYTNRNLPWYENFEMNMTTGSPVIANMNKLEMPLIPSNVPSVLTEQEKRQIGSRNWAISTFNGIADGIYEVTSSNESETFKEPIEDNRNHTSSVNDLLRVSAACVNGTGSACAAFQSNTTKKEFFTTLNKVFAVPEEIQTILNGQPELAKAKMRTDGRLALHVACNRCFPDRFRKKKTTDLLSILDHLINDISMFRSIIEIVARAFKEACAVPDKNSDLPVHLLARRLLEWESEWHFKFENGSILSGENMAKLTRLHREMALSIDIVLEPIAVTRASCCRRGSVGRILPLHIASIFIVQYNTLEKVLATYPEAATVPCNLNGLQSVFKSDALPLELLESRRNQNVSDELVKHDQKAKKGKYGVKWTQSVLDNGSHAEDLVCRSDLIFAFYPSILPFRKDADRMQRIESLICTEAKFQAVMSDFDDSLFDPAVRSAWVWMCTFDESTADEKDSYVSSVEHIVNSLDLNAVKKLSAMKTFRGQKVLDIAISPCAEVIRSRLDGNNMTTQKFSPSDSMLSISSSLLSRRSILRNTKLSQHYRSQRATLHVSSLAKQVFNVKTSAFPTSFVILPYKLKRNQDGSLSLESAASANTAAKFANLLLEFTQPRNIHHILERKANQFSERQVEDMHTDGWAFNEVTLNLLTNDLLSLFRKQKCGFLYLLDEASGVPVVPSETDSHLSFPIPVLNPKETIKNLLPLMMMGMVLMRGEKALSILAASMLEEVDQVPENWIASSQEIIGYLFSQNAKNSLIPGIADAMMMKEDLIDFVSRATEVTYTRHQELHNGNDWNGELSFLSHLLERYDPRRSFSGLKTKWFLNGNVVWSVPNYEGQKEVPSVSPALQRLEENYIMCPFGIESQTMIPDLQSSASAGVSILKSTSMFSEMTEPTNFFEGEDESWDMQSLGIRNGIPPERHVCISVTPTLVEHPDNQTLSTASLTSQATSDLAISKAWQQNLVFQETHLNGNLEKLKILDFDEQNMILGEPTLSQLGDDETFYDESTVCSFGLDTGSYSKQGKIDVSNRVLQQLCSLEERLLSREIELQQLKSDLNAFTQEAMKQKQQAKKKIEK